MSRLLRGNRAFYTGRLDVNEKSTWSIVIANYTTRNVGRSRLPGYKGDPGKFRTGYKGVDQ